MVPSVACESAQSVCERHAIACSVGEEEEIQRMLSERVTGPD